MTSVVSNRLLHRQKKTANANGNDDITLKLIHNCDDKTKTKTIQINNKIS